MTYTINHNIHLRSLFVVLLTMTLFSCQKNLDFLAVDDNAFNAPDTLWYSSVSSTMPVTQLKNELRYHYNRDNFTLQGGVVNHFNMSGGLVADIPGGALLDSSGQPYLGALQSESILLTNKGDLISMGALNISNNHQLVQGGTYLLNFYTDSGQPLTVAPNNFISLSFNSSLPFSSDMKIFKGQTNPQGDINWLLTSPSNMATHFGGNYHINVNGLSWTSCSYFLDIPLQQQTKISLTLPSNYTNANTMAFISFDQLASVLPLSPEISQRKFRSIEIGRSQPATIVVLSKQGGHYFLGHASIVTQDAGQSGFQEISLTPTITTLDDMKNYISTL